MLAIDAEEIHAIDAGGTGRLLCLQWVIKALGVNWQPAVFAIVTRD